MADDKEEVDTHDPHYEPIIKLPDVPVDTSTYEEDEDELLKLRAKLFRFDDSDEHPEWKERGTGEVKLLKHKQTGRVRIVMRRDKTHKMCANHYITDAMNLIPSAGSERAWVWHTHADFADGETKEERLAIRFANAENAQKFKLHFNEGKDCFRAKQNGDAEKQSASDSEGGEENAKEDETSKETTQEKEEEEKSSDVTAASDDAKTETEQAADEVADKLGDIQLTDSNKTDDQKTEETEPEPSPET